MLSYMHTTSYQQPVELQQCHDLGRGMLLVSQLLLSCYCVDAHIIMEWIMGDIIQRFTCFVSLSRRSESGIFGLIFKKSSNTDAGQETYEQEDHPAESKQTDHFSCFLLWKRSV